MVEPVWSSRPWSSLLTTCYLLPITHYSLHPGYVRAMEFAEEGTYNWAKAATSTHEILMDPDCPAVFGASVPKPAWLDDPQRFKEVSAKVLETTATIDHPGAQAMAWRMHGDACVRLFEHCSLLRGTWLRHALGASHRAVQGPLGGGCGTAPAPGRSRCRFRGFQHPGTARRRGATARLQPAWTRTAPRRRWSWLRRRTRATRARPVQAARRAMVHESYLKVGRGEGRGRAGRVVRARARAWFQGLRRLGCVWPLVTGSSSVCMSRCLSIVYFLFPFS